VPVTWGNTSRGGRRCSIAFCLVCVCNFVCQILFECVKKCVKMINLGNESWRFVGFSPQPPQISCPRFGAYWIIRAPFLYERRMAFTKVEGGDFRLAVPTVMAKVLWACLSGVCIRGAPRIWISPPHFMGQLWDTRHTGPQPAFLFP